MKRFPGKVAGALVTVVSLTILPGCKRPDETVKSDLGEAGYQMTAEDWFRASRGNDVQALKKFTAADFPLETKNEAGDSALHEAAAGGAEEAADYLLNRGLAVDLAGASGRTPLMAAVIADQTEMVRWLLRQGADPGIKDAEGFKPLMLAVREGSAGSVGELAAYDRGELDPALLLAALVGRADVIDALTNYGASVYARMEDGRTPLMIAAQNGHAEAVEILLDIGSSRFTTDAEGRTAADIATAAGHAEIAALIARDPLPEELTLETPEELAGEMDAFVDTALLLSSKEAPDAVPEAREASTPIQGAILSAPVATADTPPGRPPVAAETFSMPPLVMRHYREKEIPVAVKSVQGDTATVRIAGATPREVKVRAGETIPGSDLVVVRVRRRMEDSKVNLGQPAEISVVEIRDASSGTTREWISGVPSSAHDPVALVEDSATGRRYLASPGQRFSGADGAEYVISDVRPNQMVIRDEATGAVRTIPLRGPRG
jgi:ankyrin repeat protein